MKLGSTAGVYGGERTGMKALTRCRPQTVKSSLSSGLQAVSVSAKLVPPSPFTESTSDKQAILLQRFKGHSAAVTATLVVSDTENGKDFITCSLDKTVTLWNLPIVGEDGDGEARMQASETVRMQPKGAPVFALAAEVPTIGSTRRQIFCGNAAKSISTWELPSPEFEDKVTLNGHSGWVRALATDGRWLFSSGCNRISQWDLSRSVPRKFNELSIYTGDVQGLATGGGRVFSCGADGSIRSWAVGKKGELTPSADVDKAHKERVAAIIYANELLYSVSMDGRVKMWDANTLELLKSVEDAHQGGKVQCAAIGSDRNLYTGGEDKLVRRWELGTLEPAGGSALYAHNYSVRALAAGPLETLISADSSGEIAVWKV